MNPARALAFAWLGAAAVVLPGATPGTRLAISVGLLACSAFFSGSETALFSLQPAERPEGGPVVRLLERPRRTLATLLIGNEVVNVGLSSVTASLLLEAFPELPWLNVALLTPVLLVAGEVMPKVAALRLRRTWAPLAAPLLLAFSWVVAPVRVVLTALADLAVRLTGAGAQPGELAEAQLRALIDRGGRAGTLEPLEREMLHNVFEFGDLTVARLMTPRPDIFSVSLGTPWPELLRAVREAGYSRVPVWRGRPDNIVGILLVKKLLPLVRAERDGAPPPTPQVVRRLLHPARFVPTTKHAEDMLAEFRRDRLHMAIVVDEHGSVVGLVTLDDLLAELVGEMHDETDLDEPDITEVGREAWRVRASMDADDFAEQVGVELPRGDYTTVGGFVLSRLGEVPEPGTELCWNGLLFRVGEMDGHRIVELRVERRPAGDAPAPAAEETAP